MKTIKCKNCGKEYPKGTKFCPECGNHLKDNFIGFVLAILLLYFAVEIISIVAGNIIGSSIFFEKYGQEVVLEAILAIIMIVVMLLSRNSYVFTQKSEKFGKSLLVGWSILVNSIIILLINVFSLEDLNVFSLLNLVIYCTTIGLYEEFLCRGWIQNEFIERYGSTKKQVVKSIIYASLIFGLIHLVNIFTTNQGIFMTLLQVVQATSAGVLLGSIYYKTKNIWSVVFLHAFYDFSLMITDHTLIRECSMGVVTTGIMIDGIISSIIISAFYIVSSILILRSCKIDNNFESDEQTKVIENKPKLKDRINSIISYLKEDKKRTILIVTNIILLIIVCLPFSFASDEEYEKYYTCYDYETKSVDDHEIHTYFVYDFDIKHTNEITKVVDKNTGLFNVDGTPIIEKVEETTKEEINIALYYDEDEFTTWLENKTTGDKIDLDKKFDIISGAVVVDNGDYYLVSVMTSDVDGTSVYYTKLNKKDMKNDKEYLDVIVNSFVKYDLPFIENLGYIHIKGEENKFLYMIDGLKNEFFIDDEGKLYKLVY